VGCKSHAAPIGRPNRLDFNPLIRYSVAHFAFRQVAAVGERVGRIRRP
jgi:hypothetical protein